MIKSKFYKQNGDDFSGLSAALCKKKDLEGKILQGLFSEKIYAISAKVGLHRNTVIIPTRQIESQSKQFCIGDLTPFDLIWSQMPVSHRVSNFLLSKIYHGVIATALVVCLQAGVLSFFTAILRRYAQKSKNVIPWENTSEIERYRC